MREEIERAIDSLLEADDGGPTLGGRPIPQRRARGTRRYGEHVWGLCPVCGEMTQRTATRSADGREILACGDAVRGFKSAHEDLQPYVRGKSDDYLWDYINNAYMRKHLPYVRQMMKMPTLQKDGERMLKIEVDNRVQVWVDPVGHAASILLNISGPGWTSADVFDDRSVQP